MRKTFPYGHVGKGQYCHRCHQKELAMAERVAARAVKQDRLKKAEEIVGVEMDALPLHVSEKAAEIMRDIRSGTPYTNYHGKRMDQDRTVISIPIGWSYRILCRNMNGQLKVAKVLSHEEYNREHQRMVRGLL